LPSWPQAARVGTEGQAASSGSDRTVVRPGTYIAVRSNTDERTEPRSGATAHRRGRTKDRRSPSRARAQPALSGSAGSHKAPPHATGSHGTGLRVLQVGVRQAWQRRSSYAQVDGDSMFPTERHMQNNNLKDYDRRSVTGPVTRRREKGPGSLILAAADSDSDRDSATWT
jgi:hypothetical protein